MTTDTDILFSNLGPKYTVPRPIQRDILGQLLRDKPKVALTECPTGIGKSAIAVAYGDALIEDICSTPQEGVWPQSVILTATISLQEQYERDFNDLMLVKGRGNFECLANGLSAAEGACTIDKDAECESDYYEMRWRAKGSRRTVANYALYLNELFHSRGFLGSRKPRTLLVCDEAHRLLDQLTEFEKRKLDAGLASKLGLDVDGWASMERASAWAGENLTLIHDELVTAVTQGRRNAKQWLTLFRQASSMATVPDTFICLKTGPEVEAAPLWPRQSAEALFRSAQHVLLQSATMYGGHLLAELLGLTPPLGGRDERSYEYYAAPSPFDPNRWPLHFRPVVDLNARSTDEEWGRMSEVVHEYVHNFHQTKGVIHVTAANQVERTLRAAQGCGDCRTRLVSPDAGRTRETRADVLARYRGGAPGTWLCHYSVGEGESFDDDAARIQLIVKTPYPDLGDKLTKLRSEDSAVGKKLYAGMTLAKIGQIAGRVMRHEGDYGETVILDGTFRRLWSWHKSLAPGWLGQILRF